jgi:hypothetical protein
MKGFVRTALVWQLRFGKRVNFFEQFFYANDLWDALNGVHRVDPKSFSWRQYWDGVKREFAQRH